MSKRRLKFSKTGMGKFISHLDLLRAFTRAITRAELPVKYSNGFNPHQIITFSLPLAVGVTSETEYVDIDFFDTASDEEIKGKLNDALPPDLRILDIKDPSAKANDICAAKYIISFLNHSFESGTLQKFFNQEDIPVLKKTKKGEKTVNLKEFVKEYKIVSENERGAELEIILSAGGQANIKPALLTDKVLEFVSADENAAVLIHRTEIFYANGKEILKFS